MNAQGTSRLADDGVRWWRVFPGEAGELEVLRRWIEDLLPSCPARDDVTAVACELAANAICHTLSGDITVTGGIRGRIVQVSVPWSADEAERDADTAAGLTML